MEAALNRLILSDEQWDYGDVPDAPWRHLSSTTGRAAVDPGLSSGGL